MNVAALLPADRLERLRLALPTPDRLVMATDWAHLRSLLHREAIDVCVVDPVMDGAPLLEMRAAFPSMPFVVYTALAPRTAAVIAALGHAGVESLVLHDVDDDVASLRATLTAQPGVGLAALLLERLGPGLRLMPPDVARAIERAFRTPSAFRNVPDLAAAAGVSRRTIYRECERAQLASPREILAASRVLRAYALLRESDHAIEEVAETMRFSSAHHLTKTMRWATGLTTARARERIAPEMMVTLLAERLMPAGADAQLRTSTS